MMYHLLQSDPKSDLGARMKALVALFSGARKLGRILKSLSEYQKLIAALDGNEAVHKQTLEVVSRASFGVYWFYDNLGWLTKAKVLDGDEKSLNYKASVGWSLATFSSLLLALIKLAENVQKENEQVAKTAGKTTVTEEEKAAIKKTQVERIKCLVGVVKSAGALSPRPRLNMW